MFFSKEDTESSLPVGFSLDICANLLIHQSLSVAPLQQLAVAERTVQLVGVSLLKPHQARPILSNPFGFSPLSARCSQSHSLNITWIPMQPRSAARQQSNKLVSHSSPLSTHHSVTTPVCVRQAGTVHKERPCSLPRGFSLFRRCYPGLQQEQLTNQIREQPGAYLLQGRRLTPKLRKREAR